MYYRQEDLVGEPKFEGRGQIVQSFHLNRKASRGAYLRTGYSRFHLETLGNLSPQGRLGSKLTIAGKLVPEL